MTPQPGRKRRLSHETDGALRTAESVDLRRVRCLRSSRLETETPAPLPLPRGFSTLRSRPPVLRRQLSLLSAGGI